MKEKKDNPPAGPPDPTAALVQLARETAVALTERLGVDGAFVIVVRKGDLKVGACMNAPDIPIDMMFATVVENACNLRRVVIEGVGKKE